jgi:hypothetical protein
MIDSRNPIGVEDKFRGNDKLCYLKGKNMEPYISFQRCPDAAPVIIAIFAVFAILFALIVVIIKVLIFCKIFSKAGYSWALGLLMLVPIANIIMPFILAFADWPIQKEMRLLKQQQEKPKA